MVWTAKLVSVINLQHLGSLLSALQGVVGLACLLITLLGAAALGFLFLTLFGAAAYMNQIKPSPVSKEVAARYPINIFLTYTKAGVRQHTLESFPPGCTPAILGTMMQTGMHKFGDVSPFGVRLLVSSLLLQSALSRPVLCNHLRQKLILPNARAEMHFVLVGELLPRVMICGLERAMKYLHLQCIIPC